MSAQEREALVRELVTLFGPGTFGSAGPELYEFEAERIADVLLAAGWTRPVPDGDAIERAAEALDQHGYERTAMGHECPCGHIYASQPPGAYMEPHRGELNDAIRDHKAERIVAALASPAREPGRSEAEVKAEALREAAAVAGLDCDGGGWNWFAQTWAEQVAGWLEDRADQVTDTEGSKP